MNTLEYALTMSREEAAEKVSTAGLREYGTYNERIAEKWAEILSNREEGQPVKVVAALNNNDTNKVLLGLLRTDADKVLEGIAITAYVLGAEEMELYVPEGAGDVKDDLEARAEKLGIKVICSFLNVREVLGSAVHHIETMASVSDIFGEGYRRQVHVAINEKNALGQLIPVPFGTRLGDLLQTNGEEIKAIEIGSKLYDVSAVEMKIDENLPISNGVIAVIGKDRCIIREAVNRTENSLMQGCGKCTFCREGLIQLNTMLKEITDGKGKNESLDIIKEIGEAMSFSTLCSVGQTGADFVLGSLKVLSDEYVQHIKKKNCPSGLCTSFQKIYIDPKTCTGCEECTEVCPVDCIEGKAGYIHMIDEFDCTKCGKCMEVCEYGAIIQTTGRIPKLPTRLVKCGKFNK